jgi:hypothetical protein
LPHDIGGGSEVSELRLLRLHFRRHKPRHSWNLGDVTDTCASARHEDYGDSTNRAKNVNFQRHRGGSELTGWPTVVGRAKFSSTTNRDERNGSADAPFLKVQKGMIQAR